MNIRKLAARLCRRQPRMRFSQSAAIERCQIYMRLIEEIAVEIKDAEEQSAFLESRRNRMQKVFGKTSAPVTLREEVLYETLDNLRLERQLLESIRGFAENVAEIGEAAEECARKEDR